MNDEPPISTDLLEAQDSPDVVTGAFRRFRWRVVAFTVVSTIAAVSLTAWGVAAFVESRDVAERSRQLTPPQLAIYDAAGASSCVTPSFRVGDAEIGLLQIARMPGGGWALHLVGHGAVPFANGVGRFMSVRAMGERTPSSHFAAQAGMTWAESWVSVPSTVGTPFDLEFRDIRGDVLGKVTIDPSALGCSP